MRNLLAQVGHLFEAHVEKMVLALVGLVSLYLLFTQVMLGPNRVQYGGQLQSPAAIDPLILRKAQDMERAFNEPPAAVQAYRSPLTAALDVNDPVRKDIAGPLQNGYAGFYQSPLGNVPALATALLPSSAPSGTRITAVASGRTYKLPEVVEVEGVKVEHIRAAAYVPIKEVTDENPYQDSGCDINDLDLVTVEARFDLAALTERFRESFTGDEVRADWRDTTLSEPVIMGVQLQRQQRLADGQWGPWQDVPRSRVEARRELFRVAETDQSSGVNSVGIRRIQFTNKEVLCDLLQPPAYQIASAYDQWLPPSLHGEYADIVAKQEKEEQRQKREEEKATQDAGRGGRQRQQDSTTGGPDTGMGPGAGRGRGAAGGRGAIDPATGRPAQRGGRNNMANAPYGAAPGAAPGGRRGAGRGAAGGPGDYGYGMDPAMMGGQGAGMDGQLAQVFRKYEELRLTPFTDFAKLKEVSFWAHDDTLAPGSQYRYRIRLGVLNPVAGTDQAGPADAARKNQVVLWSPFSDATPAVDVQARQYFFAKDYQEGSGAVNVEVCKFILGYWRTQDFSVRPGEAIGREMDNKPKEPKTRAGLDPMAQYGMPYGAQPPAEESVFQPATIDYSTGAILVAVSRVDGWTGGSRLRSQGYYDMLFSSDGVVINHATVGTSNWPTEQSSAYTAIRKQKAMTVEAPRSWNEGVGGGKGMGPGGMNSYGMPGRMPIVPPRGRD